jgi:hypothetical protein
MYYYSHCFTITRKHQFTGQGMETGVHGKSGIHVQRHVEVDQGHDVWNATTQSLHLGAQIVKKRLQLKYH